jgi:N-acetylmuramoyl-L-alanine amidase
VLHPPKKVIRMGANNDPDIVRAIQNALVSNGIDPGPVDGKYGPKTTAAVAAFQKLNHLVADGEVGPKTAAQLGIQL